MDIPEIYLAIRAIIETAKSVRELIQGITDLLEKNPGLLGGAEQDEGRSVSRALHRINLGDEAAPRIVVVGETSVGKSALVNALFGAQLGEEKLTTDTTESVLCAQFPSNLVIYDTPGIFSDEKLENTTRLFIGLQQDFERTTRVRRVPVQLGSDPDEIIYLSGKGIRKEAPIDLVLWTVNVASPLKRATRNESHSFFSELDKAFGKHLVVAGTHLDELKGKTVEEAEEQLRGWNSISNGQIIPLSPVTGEGLTDLTTAIFERLPGNASLSKLQQSLNQVAKIDRRSFVITEMSHPLAMVMLMSGDNPQEIEIHVIILITILCSHYSVDEETWEYWHGDGLEIARQVRQTSGVEKIAVERDPFGAWENIKSWFGATFYGTRVKYHRLGVQGLSELLPVFYKLIHEFEGTNTPPLTQESISQTVLAQQKDLAPLVEAEDSEKLALRINNLLKSLLQC